jgi:hypothetical protein
MKFHPIGQGPVPVYDFRRGDGGAVEVPKEVASKSIERVGLAFRQFWLTFAGGDALQIAIVWAGQGLYRYELGCGKTAALSDTIYRDNDAKRLTAALAGSTLDRIELSPECVELHCGGKFVELSAKGVVCGERDDRPDTRH